MKYRDCMIAWNPNYGPDTQIGRGPIGAIKVGPHPDKTGWSDDYDFTGGSCELLRKKMPHWQQVAMMFTDFHSIVVRDGIDPKTAHEAFLIIDEYRHSISPDIKGATYADEEEQVE